MLMVDGGYDVFLVYFYLCMPFAEVLPRQERTVITNLEDTEGLLLLETLDVLGLVGDHVETDGLGKRPGCTNANWYETYDCQTS
jgi:hypothetical protein